MNPSLITRTTSAPLATVAARLPEIAQQHKFGVLGVHDLKEKMTSKGVPFERECRVFEVCNPQQAGKILTGNIAVSAALPCRISLYPDGPGTVLATIDPAALLGLFGSTGDGAEKIAAEVRDELVAIMDQACAPAPVGQT